MLNFKEVQDKVSSKFTLEILLEILRKQSGYDHVNITNITLGKCTKKGDSYLSNMFRFSVEYSGLEDSSLKVLHIISKSSFKNEAQRKTFRANDMFKNEINFYSKVFPELDAYQRIKNVADLFTEVPKFLYGHVDGNNDYILLEDLSYEGYRCFDRFNDLDMTHVKMMLKVFAKFHALALAYKYKDPHKYQEKILSNLQENFFHENYREIYANYQESLCIATLDAVERELPAEYGRKLKIIFEDNFYGKLCKLCENPGPLSSVTHGDAWICNFLNKYNGENNSPIRSVMIDFQLARCASFSQDLLSFIYSCVGGELINKHFEEMLQYYSEEFQKFFTQFHAQSSIDLNFLKSDFKTQGLVGLRMSIEANILTLFDDEEILDFDDVQGCEGCGPVPMETILVIKPLKTKEKRLRIANFIKHMFDHGFL